MKRTILVAALASVAILSGLAAGEAPKPVPQERLDAILRSAPPLPADLDLGLKSRLIDYINCADPNDPHDFRDQGTSTVVSSPAGNYRQTAGHRHAFFSYAYSTAGKDKPVVLVIEYPDDAKRTTTFMTHDSMRPGQPHLSFTQEVGVYSGDPLPLTGKMQYATVYAWPQDDWSPIIVENFTRYGGGGAASRIWVYAIEEMTPLAVDAPDPADSRTLDAFFCLGFLMTRDNFGWSSPDAARHMCRYMKHIGVNRVTIICYANASWGAMCTVPAWDADDKGELDGVLKAMDEEGGVGLILGIVTNWYGRITSGGEPVADMAPEQAKKVILEGFDQLIDHYGKYKSMKGFGLGSMEDPGFYDLLNAKGIIKDAVAHIKARRPDLEVLAYVGPQHLQREYFDGDRGPDMWDVISRWEAGNQPWSEFLGDEVLACWKKWKNDPAEMKAVPGLSVYEKYAPEDHRVYSLYTQQPRAMVYWDVDNSQRRSDHAATPYASLFDQFDEGWIGLHPQVNFWYRKDWVAPSTSPSMPFELAAYSRILAHRDRLAISAGTWTNKYFGGEIAIRRFAKALRSLPPVEMKDVPCPLDTARIRWTEYKGRRYVAAVSRIPFAQTITIDGKAVSLPPYELVSMADDGKEPPVVAGQAPQEYRKWLEARIAGFDELCSQVKALNSQAVPEAYPKAAAEALRLLGEGSLYAADVALGPGLVNEVRLRKEILDPPTFQAPRIDKAPPMVGDLDAWPKDASELVAESPEHIAGHIFFPNSWHGPKDLSARLRLAHDGTRLYVGLEVRDDVIDSRDGVTFMVSKAGYLDWRGQSLKPDFTWQAPAPEKQDRLEGESGAFRYLVRRVKAGYVVEGSAALADLDAAPGGAIGFRVSVSDGDDAPNLALVSSRGTAVRSWAMKQAMVIPYQVNFTYWEDARNCGKLLLGK